MIRVRIVNHHNLLAPDARQRATAKQARIILNASNAKAGIKGLVYALAGYDATRQEVIQAFKLFVREEAREYEKEFPDQTRGISPSIGQYANQSTRR